ncbi:MAG: tRNA glutamyl-Q(34) synthetase GluQRS [Burkholderiales bacterium]|nr:tRNA glutamyl-Q(34) synthetase GluQRS [Burkholderiales bacterium]
MNYVGRFAPSPTGPLHAGSLVAAMASYLDAKAHHGLWRLRMEDVDEARTVPGAADAILQALATLGMQWDGEVVWQSTRKALYAAAAERLASHTYFCGCTRREIADSRIGIAADGADVYPGTCRKGLAIGKHARALRIRVPAQDEPNECISFQDRCLGELVQHLATEVGDFVLKRADGFWAYQLAVIVDDDDQDITHVVRGADLLESTPRQIYLQRLLQVPTPSYLHVPVVTNHAGEKLSKQTGATALDLTNPLEELARSARFLKLPISASDSLTHFWEQATAEWAKRFLEK